LVTESCNNAGEGGSLIPTLSLVIPGSAMGAIILSAFMVIGINPGPRMFIEHAKEIYIMILSTPVAATIAVLIGAIILPIFVVLALKPMRVMIASLMIMCVLGGYVVYYSKFAALVTIIFGIKVYAMKCGKYPVSATVIGFLLGGIAEQNFTRVLSLSGGG